MGTKEKLKSHLNLLYFIYVSLLICNMITVCTFNILGDIKLVYGIRSLEIITHIGANSSLFFIILFSISFILIKSEVKNMYIYANEETENLIHRKLIINKVIVILTICIGGYLCVKSKNIDIIAINIFLIVNAFLIHYGKMAYLKAYLYNRHRYYLQSIYSDNINHRMDTTIWRNKIWFGNKERIDFNQRFIFIVENITPSLIYLVFFIFGNWMIKIIMIWLMLEPISIILESLLNINSRIKGVCTDISEKNRRGNRYYEIVVTDYDNKREIDVILQSINNIQFMDEVEIVHGIFSKKCFMVNEKINMPSKKSLTTGLITLIICVFAFSIGYKEYLLKSANREAYKDDLSIGDPFYNDNFRNEDYEEIVDPRERVTTKEEVIKMYEDTDKSKLSYEVITDENYYVESTFNTIEDIDGMVDYQIANSNKYREILGEYTFGNSDNLIYFDRDEMMFLISKALPDDIKEIRRVSNNHYGYEFIEYSSSKGIFIVCLEKYGYPQGDEYIYEFELVSGIKFLKLTNI